MKAVVTGGGGFLGGAVVRALVQRGAEVTSISRASYSELEELGVRSLEIDLADARALAQACAGADCVFHVAAKTGIWGRREEYMRTNVDGTRNVLAACREQRIPRLIYTSSPSVCFDGRDHLRAGNDLPYPVSYQAAYPESKARAEKLVLDANGNGLLTCSLRPHLIFGPRDPHLVPRLLERARAGKLAIVGSGRNEVTLTYVDNAAHAHLLAADALAPGAAHAGRAYFIGQEEPVLLWGWINDLLARVGITPVRRRVPEPVARGAGAVLELVGRATRRSSEPRMTRFLAAQLARSHSYDMEPARRDFGYREQVDMESALERLVEDLRARGLA